MILEFQSAIVIPALYTVYNFVWDCAFTVEKRIKYTKIMERYFILEIPWPRALYSKPRNMKFIDPGSIICIGIINTTLILYYIDKSYFCLIQVKFLDCIQSKAEVKIQK